MFQRKRQPVSQPAGDEPCQLDGDPLIQWGEVPLPASDATAGFVAFGAPGSGKSIMLQLLEQSVLPRIPAGNDMRALVYDAKGDATSRLAAVCPHVERRNSNPFDQRGWAWNMCADIREPRVAVEIGFTLIPETHESQPFFSDAARAWLIGVMLSFMLTGADWTFGDLVRVLKSERRIKAVLKRHPQTRDIIEQYFSRHDQRLVANIMSTVATKLLRFEPVAAAWDTATNRFSLEDWIKENWILILGNSEASRIPIDAINRCMFRRSVDLLLGQSESFTRQTWYFLDEVTEIGGRLPNLVSLMKKGRSKGGCVAMAMQSISALRDQSNYGQYFASEILGQIANRWIGRLECVDTAEFLSRLIGDQERTVVHESFTSGKNGNSTTTSKHLETRRLVMPSELMSIDECNYENGISGYHVMRSIGTFKANIPSDQLFDELLIPRDASVPDFVPRPSEAQFLRPWTKDDTRRFIGRRIPKCPSRDRDEERRDRRRRRPKHKRDRDTRDDEKKRDNDRQA
ncbi:MAG TPA: type IV secretion system DNA-binding domain-containing protein [Pirellulales bacterium]|jgi:hypothetical protein|nr:type IV secretion system DNA-binding domain-containing protein [Pirellulales bacterium]